jgi:tetratricopeptide (TPR) repeat protein
MKSETKITLLIGVLSATVGGAGTFATLHIAGVTRASDEVLYFDGRKRALIETLLATSDAKARSDALLLWALLPPPVTRYRTDWVELLDALKASIDEMARLEPPSTEEGESLQIQRDVQIAEAVANQAAESRTGEASETNAPPGVKAITGTETPNEKARRLWNEGYVAFNSGNLKLATQRYTESKSADPNYAPAYSSLGRIQLDAGKLDSAESLFKEALTRRPSYSAAHNNLGLVYERRGDLEAARRQYAVALQYRPDYEVAKKNLTRLEKREAPQ